MATFHYSIGGGSADDGETWTYDDMAGRLIDSDQRLSPNEVEELERTFRPVPSIMAGSLPGRP